MLAFSWLRGSGWLKLPLLFRFMDYIVSFRQLRESCSWKPLKQWLTHPKVFGNREHLEKRVLEFINQTRSKSTHFLRWSRNQYPAHLGFANRRWFTRPHYSFNQRFLILTIASFQVGRKATHVWPKWYDDATSPLANASQRQEASTWFPVRPMTWLYAPTVCIIFGLDHPQWLIQKYDLLKPGGSNCWRRSGTA